MTKEELREDPVLERIQKVVDFSAHHSRWLIGAAIVVVAVIVAVSALHRSQIRGQREAARYLSEAQASYMRGNLPAAETQLRQLVDGYGGTPAGSMGRVYLGDVLRALARPEEALNLYADAEKGSAVQQTAALRGRAAALEDLGRFAEASEAYERASAVAPFLRGEDLIGAARAALKTGQAARAKELLEKARGLVQGERQSELALLLAQAEAQTP